MSFGLYTDYYELTMTQGYFLGNKETEKAIFDYFFRKNPFLNGFVIFAGLDDLLNHIKDLKFTDDDLDYLEKLGFNKKFLNYLKNFSFNGDIYSVEEGEIVFPNEPIVRVEGNLIETQIIETILLNLLNFESLIATKAARIRLSAGNKTIIDFGMRRAQGYASLLASKAAVIGGLNSTSNVKSAKKFGLKASGTMAHSWVQSFQDELTAFRKFCNLYPKNSVLLVDTFDTLKSGLPNAIIVAKEMELKGEKLLGIRLDSGDLAYLSKQARKMLDDENLQYVKIAASNQLDELLIKSLESQNACIDIYGVGTSLITGQPDAALDGVYKLAQIDELPCMKLSENIEKTTLPGRKNILRFIKDDEFFYGDAIILEGEQEIKKYFHPLFHSKSKDVKNLNYKKLLQPVLVKGEIIIPNFSVNEIAKRVKKNIEKLPEEVKRFENPHIYKVGISNKLYRLQKDIKNNWKINLK